MTSAADADQHHHSHADHTHGNDPTADHCNRDHSHVDHPHAGHSHDSHGDHSQPDHSPSDQSHGEHSEADHLSGEHSQGDHSHGDHGHARHTHEHPIGIVAQLEHLFKPHSHDAADSVDNALVGSAEGIRCVQISLIGLAVTAAFQLAVAMASGSVAVLADTIHNFADASTAIPLWIAFQLTSKPPNTRYTYGYGRAEDLAGLFVLLMIVGSAAVAFWESLQKMLNPAPIDNLGWVAIAGLAGFAGNEVVAQYRIRVGQRIGSAALVADGFHARTDGLTSLAVVLGAAGVWIGFPQADPIIGLVITGAILLVLKDSAVQMWRRLMDAVDPELVEHATRAAAGAEGVQSVETVRARWIGHTIHAEALIVADARLSLRQAHQVAEHARHAMLHAVPRLSSVTVHVDPSPGEGQDAHAELAHHDRA